MNNEDKHTDIIAYLTGELDENKGEGLKKEIEMQEQLDDYKKLWDKSGKLSDFNKIDVDADWQKVKGRMGFKQKSKKIPFRKYMLRISAILVLAFGMAYLFNALITQVPDSNNTDYYSEMAKDENKVVNLPDGSVVTIKKGSSLYYNSNFDVGNRDIILEGEAFFNVERNESLPFRVFASNSTIEVLGTSFNVRSEQEQVELSVVTGKVAFFETNNKVNRVELVKNEMVAYANKSNGFTNKEKLDINKLAWRTGKLEFNEAPLGEMFNTVADYFEMTLDIKSNIDANEPITGNFQNKTLDDIIYAVEGASEQSITIKVKKDKIIIEN